MCILCIGISPLNSKIDRIVKGYRMRDKIERNQQRNDQPSESVNSQLKGSFQGIRKCLIKQF